jgi:Raf kinase inhibitor-like YbhB/YbcL family protein
MIYNFSKSYILPIILAIVFFPVSFLACIFNVALMRPRLFSFFTVLFLMVLFFGKNSFATSQFACLPVKTIHKKNMLTVTSTAFASKTSIPKKYTCEGENVNPPLTISGIPSTAKSLVLIMEDPDAPMGTFDHWLVWNIKPTETIGENTTPGTEGKNGKEKTGYTGPCPPTGTHRYFFKVYALDDMLKLESGATKSVVERAMKKHVVAEGELVGLYKKEK